MEKQVGMIHDEDKTGLTGEYDPKEHGQANAKAGQSPCGDRSICSRSLDPGLPV